MAPRLPPPSSAGESFVQGLTAVGQEHRGNTQAGRPSEAKAAESQALQPRALKGGPAGCRGSWRRTRHQLLAGEIHDHPAAAHGEI